MRHSTCTVSHFPNTHKKCSFIGSSFCQLIYIQSDPDYYCINVKSFYCIVWRQFKAKITQTTKCVLARALSHCQHTHKTWSCIRLAHASNVEGWQSDSDYYCINCQVILYCIVWRKIKSKITPTTKAS